MTTADKSRTEATTGLTKDERDAIKERANELRAEGKRQTAKDKSAAAEKDLVDAIAKMSEADRALAQRIHAIITSAAPELEPKTWYGMPAYAKDGKVICFFQNAEKFKARYATLGFNDSATLDDGTMWPVAYAVTTLTKADEAAITKLVKRAVS